MLRMNSIGQRKEEDGTHSEIIVKEGSMFRSQDNFQVHFETTSPAFISILLYDSQGKASQLFPIRRSISRTLSKVGEAS